MLGRIGCRQSLTLPWWCTVALNFKRFNKLQIFDLRSYGNAAFSFIVRFPKIYTKGSQSYGDITGNTMRRGVTRSKANAV